MSKFMVQTFEGKPCVRCASTERLVSTGRCRACNARYGRQNLISAAEREGRRGKPCEICRKLMDQPCYDEHGGVFRGWLCHGCNLAIGHLGDDVARAWSLYNYLARHAGDVACCTEAVEV